MMREHAARSVVPLTNVEQTVTKSLVTAFSHPSESHSHAASKGAIVAAGDAQPAESKTYGRGT